MNRYVKLFEDFDPGEFLEDFGVAQFRPGDLLTAVNKHKWRIPFIKEILNTGKIEFEPGIEGEESKIFKGERLGASIIITGYSSYELYGSPTQLHRVHKLIEKDPKNRFLTVAWKFRFNENILKTQEDKLATVKVNYHATHPKFPDFYDANEIVERFEASTLDKLFVRIVNMLDHLDAYTVADGFPNFYYADKHPLDKKTGQVNTLTTQDNPNLNIEFNKFMIRSEDEFLNFLV